MVPLFQRPYVWEEMDQWQPLWRDIARLAEIRYRDPYSGARHFLGAVVLQANDVAHGSTPTKNVIDGQQRLTSLQLFIDATAAVLSEFGVDSLARQLDDLTRNRSYDAAVEPTLKLLHTNRDRDAFVEVMNAEPPVDYADFPHSGSLIVGAHRYFCQTVAGWLTDSDGEVDQARAGALVHVLSEGLQIVVIDLKAQENSQEIFETLNARGTLLTAAGTCQRAVHHGVRYRSRTH